MEADFAANFCTYLKFSESDDRADCNLPIWGIILKLWSGMIMFCRCGYFRRYNHLFLWTLEVWKKKTIFVLCRIVESGLNAQTTELLKKRDSYLLSSTPDSQRGCSSSRLLVAITCRRCSRPRQCKKQPQLSFSQAIFDFFELEEVEQHYSVTAV